MQNSQRKPNRLIHETSLYLLQNAYSPVDWWPWSEETFENAWVMNRPIILSCGHSACHWCRTMDQECFENQEIAALMNRFFINVKVDWEERPDIDQIYQTALQSMTGENGWPLTVFLDINRRPFFGGTYFSAIAENGRLSFYEILQKIQDIWVTERENIQETGLKLMDSLKSEFQAPTENITEIQLDPHLPVAAISEFSQAIDLIYGGFNGTTKFPNPTLWQLFMKVGTQHNQGSELEMALFSLRQMAKGGLYDHLGGGFHRFSGDAQWQVPHFEKMIYDNAQLLKLYYLAFQLTNDEEFKNVAQATADYIRREMVAPEGGFYTTQAADTAEGEGEYYKWSLHEIQQLVDPESAQLIIEFYNLNPNGNPEAKFLFNRVQNTPVNDQSLTPEQLKKLHHAENILLTAREKRSKPFRDEKIITAWNGLMIGALAYSYQVSSNLMDYRSAKKAAEFSLASAKTAGDLARVYQNGQVKISAFLEDYAFLAAGLIDLFETDYNEQWLLESLLLTEKAITGFSDGKGFYYITAPLSEETIARPFSGPDHGYPSGVSVHCENLLRLAAYCKRIDLREEAEKILKTYHQRISEDYWNYASFLGVIDLYHQHFREYLFVSETQALPEMLVKFRKYFIPYRILAWKNISQKTSPDQANLTNSLFQDRPPLNEQPTCYVSMDEHCFPPVTNWEDLKLIVTSFKGGFSEENS